MKFWALITALICFSTQASHSLVEDFFTAPKEIFATYAYENYQLEMFAMKSKQVEILGVNLKTKEFDLYLTKDQYQTLLNEGYILELSLEKNAPLRIDEEYKSPKEIEDFLSDMHRRYPEITKLVSIGKSVQGRDIWAIKISDNAAIHENEPAILFNGMHHAREVMTPEVGVDIVTYLLENYQADEKVTAWVDQNEIWVLPMLNVDGNNKVWNGSTMWRKNAQGINGVDINRNYPYQWGACNGSSAFPFAQDYRGPKAASEPETQALMKLVADVRPVFDISYHSYSELVIYPYGCNGEKTATHEVVASIGKSIAKSMDYTPGTAWEILYSVDGGDIDWMYNEYQVIPYVIELNSTREGFQPRYDLWRDKTVALARKGWMLVLDRLAGSGIRGQINNFNQSKSKKFEIEVTKADGTLFQRYQGNPDGTFHIVVNPGEYHLKLIMGDRGVQAMHVVVENKRVDTHFNL